MTRCATISRTASARMSNSTTRADHHRDSLRLIDAVSSTSSSAPFSAFVHGVDPLLAPRTRRALAHAAGAAGETWHDAETLAHALLNAEGLVALAEAGAWFPAHRKIPPLPSDGEWTAIGARKGNDGAAWTR